MNPDFRYMKEAVASDIATLLMEEHNLSFEEALDVLLTSETYNKLSNPETGLYFQSPRYILDYLESELKYGKLE